MDDLPYNAPVIKNKAEELTCIVFSINRKETGKINQGANRPGSKTSMGRTGNMAKSPNTIFCS